MGKVIFNITVSLDGFVAGPHDGPDNGLGDGGDALFKWYFSGCSHNRCGIICGAWGGGQIGENALEFGSGRQVK